MSKPRLVAVVICAAVLAASLVSPALGGPSLGSVAGTAKKALRTAKKANSTAKSAKSSAANAQASASSAGVLANAANSKADQALARPVVTAGGITIVAQTAGIAPNDFNSVAAVCPGGQRVISGGAYTVTGAGGNWINVASDDRTAWIAGGEDLGGSGGTVTAEAYCVPAGQAAAARVNRAALRSELRRYERRKAQAKTR